MVTKKAEAGTLHIDALKQGRVTLTLVGTTGFYYNAMSAKVMRTLLVGGGKKTAAERKNIKHDAEEEYRDSVYRMASGDTFLGFLSDRSDLVDKCKFIVLALNLNHFHYRVFKYLSFE
jgi:hypothetical protein